jgi:hypothetical protein
MWIGLGPPLPSMASFRSLLRGRVEMGQLPCMILPLLNLSPPEERNRGNAAAN